MSRQKEYFTDKEKRLLLSALRREKDVCRKIDEEDSSNGKTKLVPIVESLENKFCYDRIINQIRKDTIEDFISTILKHGTNENITSFLQDAAKEFLNNN